MAVLKDVAVIGVSCVLLGAGFAAAAEPGKAVGSFMFDATTVPLTMAVETRVEGLFDSSKKDTLVVLTDKALGATAPGDDVDLSLRARKGEIAALTLRIDGAKLVNVSVFHKGLAGKIVLPGAWFDYKAAKPGTGTLKLAPRDFDGKKYSTNVEFAASVAAKPAPPAAPAPVAAPKPAPATPAPAPVKAAPAEAPTPPPPAVLVKLLMDKNEAGALEVVKSGVDPNGKDQYGMPVLSWAVMMCQPKVVQALVDKKANVNYQRAPGLTVLAEAGACPEAAKILKAAGAK